MNERQVAEKVRRFSGQRWRLAVAFWGTGGADRLGLRGASAKGVQVLCNLESGACNPDEVAALKARGVRVRTNARLHAKVYTDGHSAIVGSSNASANGLAAARGGPTALIEASLLTTDADVVAEVVDWLERLWNAPESLTVTGPMLREARARWALRPHVASFATRGGRAGGLLARCRRSPELFENVYAAIYDRGLSDDAGEKVRQLNRGAASAEGISRTDFGSIGAYEDWDHVFPDGAWLVDVDMRPTLKQPRISTYKVHDPVVMLPSLDLVLAVARRIVLAPDGKPEVITADDRRQLSAFTRRMLKSRKRAALVPLIEVASNG